MSHFTVLVPASNEEELEAMLQPYHEYESTDIMDEYVVWVDEHDYYLARYQEDLIPAIFVNDEFVCTKYDDRTKSLRNYEEREVPASSIWTLEEYMLNWHSMEYTQDGRYGRFTNPCKKWDWWVIGGRWEDTLPFKDGTRGSVGEAGFIDWEAYFAEWEASFAFIDLEGKWNENGRMGWWAIVTDENPDYPTIFRQFIASLPTEQVVYLIDCHI